MLGTKVRALGDVSQMHALESPRYRNLNPCYFLWIPIRAKIEYRLTESDHLR